MVKKNFLHGLTAGVLAALAAVIYDRIYYFAFETNFLKIINIPVIIGANLAACLLAAFGYGLLRRWLGTRAELPFNLVFSILSFATIIFPISMKLPLDIQNPELFPGLAIPMHLFPAMAWFTISPAFRDKTGS